MTHLISSSLALNLKTDRKSIPTLAHIKVDHMLFSFFSLSRERLICLKTRQSGHCISWIYPQGLSRSIFCNSEGKTMMDSCIFVSQGY